MSWDVQPGNASAPQNQLQRCSWGIRPESETGDYTGGAIPMSSAGQAESESYGLMPHQNNHFNRYTTPVATPPTSSKSKTIPPNTISLNFR